MNKLKKVVYGLGCLVGEHDMKSNKCAGCGYRNCATFSNCIGEIARDSLSLLKTLESVKPIIKQEMDDVSSCLDDIAYCGKCGAPIGRLKQKYCSNCGRKVAWNG